MRLREIRAMDAGRVLRAVMCAVAVAFLLAALLAPDRAEMLSGLERIVSQPAQLTKDYFKPELGSLSGAMLNTALVGALCCALMFLPGAKVTGVTVLGYLLTVSFCTYGINILNMLPLMAGAFLNAGLRRKPTGSYINHAMFATGLSPLVSEMLFRYPGTTETHPVTTLGVALALGVGIAAGCAMPSLCAHAQSLHKGYDLFNAGPAAGLLCMLIYATMYRVRGIEPPVIDAILGEGHRTFVNVFCGAMFALMLALGLLLNGGFAGYRRLLADSGHRSDFLERYGAGPCLINMGVYGMIILLYYNLIGATFTGATMGAILGMLSCGCNGSTPRNVFPIILGYVVMGVLHRLGWAAYPINAQAIVVGVCFGTGLSPIAGEYGVFAGVVAGILHYCMVTSVPGIHGGFNLYNGGFTAGIVAFVYLPVLEHFHPRGGSRQSKSTTTKSAGMSCDSTSSASKSWKS